MSRDLRVRPAVLLAALTWLKRNNALYRGIHISEEAVRTYHGRDDLPDAFCDNIATTPSNDVKDEGEGYAVHNLTPDDDIIVSSGVVDSTGNDESQSAQALSAARRVLLGDDLNPSQTLVVPSSNQAESIFITRTCY